MRTVSNRNIPYKKNKESSAIQNFINLIAYVDSTYMENYGGADRGRTDDFLLAKQALSQTELQPQKMDSSLFSTPSGFH